MSNSSSDYSQRELYKSYGSADEYGFHSGKFVLPLALSASEIAAGTTPVVVVQAHAPFVTRRTPFDVLKEGAPPKIQAPKDVAGYAFLGGTVYVHGPAMMGDAFTKRWHIEGDYTFVSAFTVDSHLDQGLVLSGYPFPTPTQQAVALIFGQGSRPATGPVSVAGNDVLACHNMAQNVSFTNEFYSYIGDSLFPGRFFSDSQIIGAATSPAIAV